MSKAEITEEWFSSLSSNVRFDADSVAEIQYATLEPAPSTKAGYRLSSYDL